MRRNDLIETKGLEINALILKLHTLKRELSELILDKNMNKLKDLKVLSKKKKDIAQTLTIIRQKAILEELESQNQEKIETKNEKKETKVKGGAKKAK